MLAAQRGTSNATPGLWSRVPLWARWTGGILIGLIVLGSLLQPDTDNKQPAEPQAASSQSPEERASDATKGEPQSAAKQSAENSAENSDNIKHIGEQFQLGDFAYTIIRAWLAPVLGNEVINHRADDGAVFVVVNFQITNTSSETETVMTDDFELKAGNLTYKPDSNGVTAYVMSRGGDFILSELQPRVTKESATVFLVPNDVAHQKLYLRVPKKGFFSSGEVMIALN
jgi:uncharacterized protein DUF4352